MQTPAPLSTRQAHALMHFTVLVWGFTAILGRLISLSAITLVWYRLMVVVAVMSLVLWWRKLPWRVTTKQHRFLGLVGALVAIHWLLFYGCIKYAGVSVAVLCLSTVTFFTALLEPFVFRRRPLLGEVLLGLAVMVGVGFLVKVETGTDEIGLALGLGSALFSAAFGSLNGKLARQIPGEVVTFWELFAAGAVTTAFLALHPHEFIIPTQLSTRDWLLLIALAIGCTVLPWLWSLRVLQTLAPYTLALAVSLETVYAMAIAWFIFPETEQLTWRFYVGAAFLLVLVALGTWRKHRHERASR